MKITRFLFTGSVDGILRGFADVVDKLERYIIRANEAINDLDEMIENLIGDKETRKAEVDRAVRVLEKLKKILN